VNYLNFLGWLFDFQYDSTERLVFREFILLKNENNLPCLMLIGARQSVSGIFEFMELLDNVASDGLGDSTSPFRSFFETYLTLKK